MRKAVKHVMKAVKPHVKIPQSHLFKKGFLEKKKFALLKMVYKDIVEAFFKRKAPKANANFYVFESQCPKMIVLSKALKAKLSFIPNEVANLS